VTVADHATLDDLWQEMSKGKVIECSLPSKTMHVYGIQMGDGVYIDPRSAILETLLHELAHRRHPKMGERAVTTLAKRLARGMSEQDKRRWWRRYQRTRRKGRPVEVE